jgi:hypothetical protein
LEPEEASSVRQRPIRKIRLGVERLDEKQLLSAVFPTRASAVVPARVTRNSDPPISASAVLHHRPPGITGITMDRITNPTPFNAILTPPFKQVLVQSIQPVPGHVYNVLFLSVWNGTGRTFTASDGLAVKLSNQGPAHAYPILTGSEEWKPGQRIVFYVLTKNYYPLSPQVSAGFSFNFVDPRVTAIPGPSGIFLRLKYDPATFSRVLDSIVVAGPGANGHLLGIADTSIWEIIPARNVIRL